MSNHITSIRHGNARERQENTRIAQAGRELKIYFPEVFKVKQTLKAEQIEDFKDSLQTLKKYYFLMDESPNLNKLSDLFNYHYKKILNKNWDYSNNGTLPEWCLE